MRTEGSFLNVLMDLDSETVHLYNINKKSLIEGCPNYYKMFMKMFNISQNLNTLLPYKNAFHMMHNSNMKTQTHQRKNLNSPRHL